ncbi:hypothetical protein [Paenibacillus urinalis]|uniref:hypothetical protein n=1 Tax=Paenibacillus urinalis TaxID=521520 RepID=UPI00196173F5
MNKTISLNREQFKELAGKDVGPRIRYIRELLQKEFGDQYSSRSVALRIEIISPQALSVIERGETKDCPYKVACAIAKDFNVDVTLFNDDFYMQGFRVISIPFQQEKYKTPKYRRRLGLMLFEVDSEDRRQIIHYDISERKLNTVYMKFVVSVAYSLFGLFNLKKYSNSHNVMAAESYLDWKKSSRWITSDEWSKHFDQLTESSVQRKATKQ